MGPFESFYDSPLQHPWLLWAAALLACAVVATRPRLHPQLRRYLFALVGLSLADAWLSSDPIYGIGRLEGTAQDAVPLFFVLAGDLRFLLLATAARTDGALDLTARPLLTALGLTLIVPVSTQLFLTFLPDEFNTSRVMFLFYEVAFCLLTLAVLIGSRNVRRTPWLARVCGFVLLYYGLWATADAIILFAGSDLGFGLRVVPNLLYYGGLIAAMAWFAPRVADAQARA